MHPYFQLSYFRRIKVVMSSLLHSLSLFIFFPSQSLMPRHTITGTYDITFDQHGIRDTVTETSGIFVNVFGGHADMRANAIAQDPRHITYFPWRPSAKLARIKKNMEEYLLYQHPCVPCSFCGTLMYPERCGGWIEHDPQCVYPLPLIFPGSQVTRRGGVLDYLRKSELTI